MTGHFVPKKALQRNGMSPIALPLVSPAGGVTWTNMPLAEAFFNGSHAHVIKAQLNDFTEARLSCGVNSAGTTGATLELRYALSFTTASTGFSSIGTSTVFIPLNVGATVAITSWIPLVAAARADVFVAIVGAGGDGVLDPVLFNLVAEFRGT